MKLKKLNGVLIGYITEVDSKNNLNIPDSFQFSTRAEEKLRDFFSDLSEEQDFWLTVSENRVWEVCHVPPIVYTPGVVVKEGAVLGSVRGVICSKSRHFTLKVI